jgi:hypothetical protein
MLWCPDSSKHFEVGIGMKTNNCIKFGGERKEKRLKPSQEGELELADEVIRDGEKARAWACASWLSFHNPIHSTQAFILLKHWTQ